MYSHYILFNFHHSKFDWDQTKIFGLVYPIVYALKKFAQLTLTKLSILLLFLESSSLQKREEKKIIVD